MENDISRGGCLCGAVRYEFSGDPVICGYCHCRACQRATGAPVFAAVVVPTANFRVTSGTPQTFQSSARGMRHFCGTCGTSLFFEPLDRREVWEILAGSLDEPNGLTMTTHIWTSSAVPWMHIEDDLPRFPENRPKGFGESKPTAF